MSIQGSGEHPTFPAQWLSGLLRGTHGCAGRPSEALASSELDASIRGVRTTRFCRTLSCRSLIGTASVHRDPPHDRGDHDTPLWSGRDGSEYSPDFPFG